MEEENGGGGVPQRLQGQGRVSRTLTEDEEAPVHAAEISGGRLGGSQQVCRQKAAKAEGQKRIIEEQHEGFLFLNIQASS